LALKEEAPALQMTLPFVLLRMQRLCALRNR